MMGITNVEFKGIVRSTSAQNNADGNCEEVINLRHESGVWKVVGKKKAVIENVDYEQVYVHKYSKLENYIGVKDAKVVWFASTEGDEIKIQDQEICSAGGNVSLNHINNILLIKDNSSIYKSVFKGGKYEVSLDKLPDIPRFVLNKTDISTEVGNEMEQRLALDEIVDVNTGINCGYQYDTSYHTNRTIPPGLYNSEVSQYKEEGIEALSTKVQAEFQKVLNSKQGYNAGYVFVSAAYQLFDGSISKQTPPVLIELGSKYDPDIFYIYNVTSGSDNGAIIVHGYIRSMILSKLSISLKDLPDYETYKGVIDKINVYATPVMSYYDLSDFDANYLHFTNTDSKRYNLMSNANQDEAFKERNLTDIAIDKLLFYKVTQFDLDDTSEKDIDFKDITTNPTMPVDSSGWWETAGDMFVYNTRLHLFNQQYSIHKSENLSKLWSDKGISNNRTYTAVTYLKTELDDLKVKNEFTVHRQKISEDGYGYPLPPFLAFPDSRAYKIEVYYNNILYYVVKLHSSDTYNFAYALPTEADKVSTGSAMPDEVTSYEGGTNLIVSAATNPYYFPPEHSYPMPGEVLNLAVNTEQISASQVGMYPLYVFTTEGIYALQAGSGNILYSNVVPVSAEVAVKGSSVLQTKYGIVFVTESGLKLISGQQVVDLSEPLKGMPDMNIHKSEQYIKATTHEYALDLGNAISRVDFREYIRSAVFGYDISRDEIIASNPRFNYTYVYNLQAKFWHKITETFSNFNRHLGLRVNGENLDMCDIRREEDTVLPVWIQTRPINMDSFGFKRIARAAMRGELKGMPEERMKYYGCYVFASDDLVNWACVAEKIFAGSYPYVILSRVCKSFRYFVLLSGGYVNPGHVIAVAEIEGEEKWDNRLR